MRLKTKIIFICCISVLLTSVVCSVSVYRLVKKSSLEAAEAQGYQKAGMSFSELEKKSSEIEPGQKEASMTNVLEYLFKEQRDEMLLCFSEAEGSEEAVFNSTVFQKSDLEALSYHSASEADIEVAQLQWEGMHFFVFQKPWLGEYTIYRLEDVTYVWERLGLLRLGLIFLTLLITTVVSLILLFIITRVLRPLQQLSTGAKQIARGRYDERIAVVRRDEIGELSEDFNQMAEAVQFRSRKMEEEERKRTLFMANLTHELKTPMTAISGYARTLLTAKLPEGDKEEALSYIYEESCRLERLSQKMMELLLLEEENQTDLEEVSAGELFRRAGEACSRSLREDDICLECLENGETFLVDADLFTEVLINLIDNARKASSPGSRILLSARENEIEVRDFGSGIPDSEIEKILEPFYRVDKSRSRKAGGAGLGLAITAQIVRQHHAEMHMESVVGEGTRVILQFV